MRGRALRGPFPKIRMVAEKGSVKMPLASRIRYCTAAPAEIGIEPIAACAALVILRGLEVQEGAAFAGPPRITRAFVGVTGAAERAIEAAGARAHAHL